MNHQPFSNTRWSLVRAWCTALVCGGSVWAQTDFTDTFNTGTDVGWKHFDLSVAGLPGGPYGTYTFPPVRDARGYRITSIANPVPGDFGPGRAFSYREAVYTRGQFLVDVIDWTVLPDVAFGFLFRANTVGAGTTAGYVMNYNALDEDLQLNVVEGEAATVTIAETPVYMDPERFDYRWELTTWGGNLLGRVFQDPDFDSPIASVFAIDETTASGVTGLFNFDRDGGAAAGAVVAASTFDNYVATAPAAGSLAPVVIELLPTPASGSHEGRPLFKVAVLDRDTTVKPDSFVLTVDDVAVPSSGANGFTVGSGVQVPNNAETFPGATLTYTPAANMTAGRHRASVVYEDSTGAKHTNNWVFSADYFVKGAISPGARGFNVRFTQAEQQAGGLGDSLQRAFLQLATNSPIAAGFETNLVAEVINYSQKAVIPEGGSDGNFEGDQPFPGQTEESPTDNSAMEITCWLDLPAGTTRFGVVSDDGFQLSSSALSVSPILSRVNGSTANVEFSVFAAEAGLYPFTLVWYENTGGAHLEWFVVLESGEKVLVNTPGAPAAYVSATTTAAVSLLASPLLSGAYIAVDSAVVDAAAKTITVPVPVASTVFYRVSSASGEISIQGIHREGDSLVIRYQ